MTRNKDKIISAESFCLLFTIKELIIVVTCLVFLLLPFENSAVSKERPSIKDMVVINSEHNLLLYFQISEPFTPEMKRGIENGIPITFSFYIKLYKKRSGWFDKELVSHKLERSLAYDNLKDEYSIRLSGKKNRVVTRTNLEDAKNLMKKLNDFEVIELEKLEPGDHYCLRTKVSLEKKTLPFNFQNMIPFWNLWEFDTDWTELNFSIPASSKIEINP
ncbi:MAG: DUF4390 domain-containing protein [Desulfobia sp.]